MFDTMITRMYNKRVYKGKTRLTAFECTHCFRNKISEYNRDDRAQCIKEHAKTVKWRLFPCDEDSAHLSIMILTSFLLSRSCNRILWVIPIFPLDNANLQLCQCLAPSARHSQLKNFATFLCSLSTWSGTKRMYSTQVWTYWSSHAMCNSISWNLHYYFSFRQRSHATI